MSAKKRKSHDHSHHQQNLAAKSSPLREFWLPLVLTLCMVPICFSERVLSNSILLTSCWGAIVFLLLGQLVLVLRYAQAGEGPVYTIVLRKQHYIQALVQLSVFIYWGWFWRPVYDHAVLIVAQLLFAYGVDLLLSWWRRGNYVFGFGPFPIVFSINLFLWFRDDWFYLQFIMIAVGILGKEYVRWNRDGKYVHIFNPSAFSLGLFSLILLLTNTTDLTWGQEIASTLTLAPNIYLFLFLGGLVVMYFFAITLVAGSAAFMLFALSGIYYQIAGVPYFVDSDIPAAVFLGLHLLITDPSTSPRKPLGKAIFGALYGVGVFVLYSALSALGTFTFYDKLMIVPILNLSVIGIDRLVSRLQQGSENKSPWLAKSNLLFMAIWIVGFGSMTLLGKTDSQHTGDSLPFWQQACIDGRGNACDRLMSLESTYCKDNSAWACNELGVQYREGKLIGTNNELALGYFSRSCNLRFQAACLNLLDEQAVNRAQPQTLDLRLLLREGGRNLMEMPETDLYQRACKHGWQFACEQKVSVR